MSVTVEKPPRAPRLTGDYAADMTTMYGYFREMSRWSEQAWQRIGANTDVISSTAQTANAAQATAQASQAGATIPTEGGAITLSPANPLSYTLVSKFFASITVATHTRTGAASPLVGANVGSNVARGDETLSYYVYYSDAGDVGGAQTFLATTSLSTVTGTAGYRIIGTIEIPPAAYTERDFGEGSEP